MGKLGYQMKNMFKSKEQIEIEARIKFNQTRREFDKYYKDIDVTIKDFEKMAKKALMSGNRDNALACAKFIKKLQLTQVKVQGLIQRFEMMNSMQKLTGMMSKFMASCAEMGFKMDADINLRTMMRDNVAMEKAVAKLDIMSDQLESVFDTIDQSMGSLENNSQMDTEADPEAEALLESIMGRDNLVNAVPGAMTAAADETKVEATNDESDELLRKMMQELGG